jgi:energy-coupling factor transport system permease protein
MAKIHREVIPRIKILAPLIIMSFFLWALFHRWSLFSSTESIDVIFILGPLTIDRIGLMYGLAMPFRVMIVLISPIIFLMTTKLSDIIQCLTKLGIPYSWAFTFGLSTKLVSVIGNEFTTIKQAQMSRGLETERGGLIKRIKSHVPIIVPLTVRGIELSDQLGMSMSIKGFDPNNKRTFYRQLKMRKIDFLILIMCLASLFVSVVMRVSGIGVVV